jgi:predicted glycoside hydrolase/deacetylase ChbG (UPF0249 family)
MADAPRRIWLCADDYGISPAVSAGIRQLIARRRINATSVMVASPYFNLAEAEALDALNAGEPRAALGLHVTLTAPFAPVERLVIEIGTQLRLFLEAFGRLPDFLDGHQHVHLAPQVRDALLKVATEAAPRAWVRQCGRPPGARRLRDAKALVLDILSLAFRRQALELGVATNPAFAGSYEFTAKADFAKLFPGFLTGLPDGGLVMCHPGFVDDELRSLDPLTDLRERELAYFESEAFTIALAAQGATLAEPAVA